MTWIAPSRVFSRTLSLRRWWRRVGKLDQALFDAVAAAKLPGLENVLPRLSRSADHSVLWFVIAATMAAAGRTQLRRGALRGLAAIGVASPVVNLVGKQLFRRVRPQVYLVPPARVRGRVPTSPAFPSGHAAAAAAFTTGVALETPRYVVLPVAGLAAFVAGSRVYNGAHYPGDVLAGAALGAAAGFVTRLIWPVPADPADAVPDAGTADVHEDGSGVVAVVNTGAGRSVSTVGSTLRGALPRAEIVEVGGDDEMDGVFDHVARRAQVLAVVGGDGTVNSAARAALRYDMPLLTVPAGTLDHFARAIGIESVADAVAAYRSGRIVRVDVGRISQPGQPERIFLNTASFGAYTELAGHRDRLRGRLGTWLALAVAGIRTLGHAEPVEALIDGRRHRIWLAFVGNCRYASWGAVPTSRSQLADGQLDIRLITMPRRASTLRAFTALLAGHLRIVSGYSAWRSPQLHLACAEPSATLAHDGETGTAGPSVTFAKHPTALAVFQHDRTRSGAQRPDERAPRQRRRVRLRTPASINLSFHGSVRRSCR